MEDFVIRWLDQLSESSTFFHLSFIWRMPPSICCLSRGSGWLKPWLRASLKPMNRWKKGARSLTIQCINFHSHSLHLLGSKSTVFCRHRWWTHQGDSADPDADRSGSLESLSRRESVSYLFQLLESARALWLMVTSFQSLLTSQHFLLLLWFSLSCSLSFSLKAPCDYIMPSWIIQNNLSISKSLTPSHL